MSLEIVLQTPQLLIAEDDLSLRTLLKKFFIKKGYTVETAEDGKVALTQLQKAPPQVALIDINMPFLSGLEILKQLSNPAEFPIIVMTAQDTLKNAVEAMKRGAFDYLTKPFELEELEMVVERALENQRLSLELNQLKSDRSPLFEVENKIIGKSKAIQKVYKLIGKVAASSVPVLITGESGTGKELAAKSIHQASSRAAHPFIAVNCAAVPKDLLESELFGYRKGAFTGAQENRVGYFEAAHQGTLFLDELGDMPPALQAKFLRVLQEKEVTAVGSRESKKIDVRIISATHQDLADLVKKGDFREDLYFRLKVIPIELPPLRERKEDIPLLINYFLNRFQKDFSTLPKQLDPKAFPIFQDYAWPGNIREMENLLKRVMLLSEGSVIKVREIQEILDENSPLERFKGRNSSSIEILLEQYLQDILDRTSMNETENLYETMIALIEKPLLSLLLKKTRGNQIQSAKILGLNRNTLRKKIKQFKIHLDRFQY